VYYLNESFDPEGGVNPEDSPYAFYLTSYNATSWVDHVYEPHANSSYINLLFVNESVIEEAGINVTKTGWLYFKSRTPAVKPYYINVTNAPSSTNRTFGETGVAYSGTSGDWGGIFRDICTVHAIRLYAQHLPRLYRRRSSVQDAVVFGRQ